MLIVLGILHQSQPLTNAQVSDSNQLIQSDILISDYELALNTQTATYDTYNLVHDRFPYLEKDYDYLVAISDMQLLNMSFVLSMLDVLNQQKSTTNILNLASGEIFPDPEVFGCQMHDMTRTEDVNHKEESAHEEFPNVCNSQVTNTSDNKEQYKALAVTLNTLRQQYAQQRAPSSNIKVSSESPTIATLAVNNVAQMVIDNQSVRLQRRTILINEIAQKYVAFVPQSLIHIQRARTKDQAIKNELLSPDERIAFINSLNLQWPWSNDEDICLSGYIHGSGFSGGEKTNGYDFGKCTAWNWGKNAASQVFDVKSMSDGVKITNKHENSPTSSNYYCTDNMVVISTTKKFNNKDHTFYAVYYHLETPSKKNEYKKGDTVAKIASTKDQAIKCLLISEYGPHLHLSMFIDSYDLYLTDASNFPKDGWEIGGWRYTLKQKNTSDDNYTNDIGEYTSYTNICDKTVLGISSGTIDKRGPIKNLCSTPDQNFTLRQSNDETTNGRWPKLEWSYNRGTPAAYYLEVTKQEDTYWVNPVVYECIKPSSLLWWWQTNNYVPTSIDFQTERTGVFKWRVRSSDVSANDMNACKDANRGKWDKWSTEKTFTNRGLQTQYPGNSERGFFQTFLSFS